MKFRLSILSVIIFGLMMINIGWSSAELIDRETTSASFSASECFENCNALSSISEISTDPEILFYINSSDNVVGFILDNVNNYDFFKYKVTYDHITEFGKLTEVINGAVDNSTHKDTIIEEEIILGTETAGGTRVYHSDIEEIKLEVFLENSGIIERTLTKTLYL